MKRLLLFSTHRTLNSKPDAWQLFMEIKCKKRGKYTIKKWLTFSTSFRTRKKKRNNFPNDQFKMEVITRFRTECRSMIIVFFDKSN